MCDVDAEFDEPFDSALLEQVDAIEHAYAGRAPAASTAASPPPSSIDRIDPSLEAALLAGADAIDDEVAAAAMPRSRVALAPRDANVPASSGRAGGAKPPTPRRRPTTSPSASRARSQCAPQGASEVHASTGQLSMAPAAGLRSAFAPRGKVWSNYVFTQQGNRVSRQAPDDAALLDEVPDALTEREIAAIAPRAAPRPPPEMRLRIDEEQARTWVYPTNKPLRSYQLNIVRKALFNNVLVALPTGLGKTFIAAVVILNMFRWFPGGKIIFVAPTRPLVTQQQQACHASCGLPWDTAIELTGNTKRGLRQDEWREKRIFYMTPQTFENDLLSTRCDARDVVCVVVDEAHRATGNYAYCKVIRHLMYHNPHFRVLALTATPGSNAERVQEVVDNLHIGLIEIRTEDALDIQQYVHRKHEELVRVSLGGALLELRSAWAALMQTYAEPLQKHGVLKTGDMASLRPFAVRAQAAEPHGRAVLGHMPHLRNCVTQLASMALALQYLAEHSVRVFRDRVMELVAPDKPRGPRATQKDRVFAPSNPRVARVLQQLEAYERSDELLHPKMRELRRILLDHFNQHAAAQAEEQDALEESGCGVDGGPPRSQRSTRAMVFCSYREVVTEIAELLNHAGLRATPFIGQATDARGNRGYTQKVQDQVIQDFQRGKHQVLVATSIGEEGLDIGEVDLIVCYEAVRDSVRTLQRVGRTGRKRDGRIVVLMTEGREEYNWQHSKESYKNVQKLVRSANLIDLYTDVDRLVPAHLHPEPVMCEVDQPPFDPKQLRGASGAKRASRKREPKPKKPARPAGGDITRFCTARELRQGSSSSSQHEGAELDRPSSRSADRSTSTANLSDDSDDEELSRGLSLSVQSGRSSLDRAPSRPGSQQSSTPTQALPWSSSPRLGSTRRAASGGRAASSTAPQPPSTAANAMAPVSPQFERYEPHPLISQLQASESDAADAWGSDEQLATIPAPERMPSPSLRVPGDTRTEPPGAQPPSSPPSSAPLALASPTAPRPRRRRAARTPERAPERRKRKRIGASPSSRLLFRYEAERETDSEEHGETDEDDDGPCTDEENDEDRAAVGDFAPTQAPAGYHQQGVYMQSILSQQEPSPFRRRDRLQELLRRRAEARPSSEGELPVEEYSQDSFVVGDEEIEWDDSASSLAA